MMNLVNMFVSGGVRSKLVGAAGLRGKGPRI